MQETSIRKEVYYDPEIGFAEFSKVPQYPDRVWVNADFYSDLTKVSNYKKIREITYDIFLYAKDCGFKELYCYVDNQKSFDFNMSLGWEPAFEYIPDTPIEFMKVIL